MAAEVRLMQDLYHTFVDIASCKMKPVAVGSKCKAARGTCMPSSSYEETWEAQHKEDQAE